MVQADYLFLMTDVDCLYDKNPRIHPEAHAIEVVEDISSLEADVSSAGSALGTGGMSTKIVAAGLATSAGVTTVITRSSNPGNIVKIISHAQAAKQAQTNLSSLSSSTESSSLPERIGSLHFDNSSKTPLHTRFTPDPDPIRDRRFWLLHGLAAHGTIFIDEGAYRALLSKAGLLPAGIIDVEGHFAQQEAVRLVVVVQNPSPHASKAPYLSNTQNGVPLTMDAFGADQGDTPKPTRTEVGRALVNYSAAEVARIKGLQSTEIQGTLGYADSEYVALRENVSLLKREKPSRPVTPGRPGTPTGSMMPNPAGG